MSIGTCRALCHNTKDTKYVTLCHNAKDTKSVLVPVEHFVTELIPWHDKPVLVVGEIAEGQQNKYKF